jgi:hypothetical protein
MLDPLQRSIGHAIVLICCTTAPLRAQRLFPIVELPNSEPRADTIEDASADSTSTDEKLAAVLTPDEWRRVDDAVERALAWLSGQQQADGSFPTLARGQPGVTSLCLLAYMAHGHIPGEGQYGSRLAQATDFILECQKPNGLVTAYGPEGLRISREVDGEIGVTAAYNHAISSLALAESYGMSQSNKSATLERAINKALAATLEMQRWEKARPEDRGGWRYVGHNDEADSDLSITGWELMFLRSARNAGFNVPKQAIDDAVQYVRRSFDAEYGAFRYMIGNNVHGSRGMAGAGILALGHAGFHDSYEAQRAGKWLLQYSFESYNEMKPDGAHDRYHYSLFNCCQGMYQLGSPYWEQFFPPTVRVLLTHQRPNGSWDAESYQRDGKFGNSYTTALVVLSLGAPNQFLPVFQR